MTEPPHRHHPPSTAIASSSTKKQLREATECYISRLPDHVLRIILCKLPTAILVKQCRCVCKLWRTILLDPNFGHLYLSLKQPSTLFLCMKGYTTLHWLEFQECISFFNPVAKFIKKYQFLNSCNGLLYLCEYKRRHPYFNDLLMYNKDLVMYILNPVTAEYMRVPPAKEGRSLETGLGALGFSPQNNEFKAIRIYKLREEGDLQADVYALGTGSWRTVGAAPEIFESCLPSCWDYKKVFFNGRFHWLLLVDDDFDQICTFDFDSEQFGSIELPPYTLEDCEITNLGVLGDSIYVCFYPYESPDLFGEIWVMKEYGVVESWTKMFVIENKEGIENPFLFGVIAFLDNGDILLSWDGYLVRYDRETESYMILGIEGIAILHEPRFALLKEDAKGDSSKVFKTGSRF